MKGSITPSTTTHRPSVTIRQRPTWRGSGRCASSASTSARKKARQSPAGPLLRSAVNSRLFAVAHEAEQEGEHVDEVEIEVQRPHDHDLAHHVGAGDMIVHALDLLRVVSGKAGEQQHADG